jgi:hypothetical protein
MSKPRRQFVWDGLTVAEWEYANRYIRNAADLFDLRDWTIILEKIPADDVGESGAMNAIPFGRRRIRLRLGKDWAFETNDDKRWYIAHELLHAHWEPTFDMIQSDMEQYVGRAAFSLFRLAYLRQAEFSLDSCAKFTARLLPEYKFGVGYKRIGD